MNKIDKQLSNLKQYSVSISKLISNSIDEQLFNLILYSKEEDVNLVKELLDKGELDVNWIKHFDDSPISILPFNLAVKKGYLETVKMMIDYGYPFNKPELKRIYPNNINPTLTKNIYPIHAAAESGFDNIVELLLNKGVDPNIKCIDDNVDGNCDEMYRINTPLLYALFYNQYTTVKLLLERGADPNLYNIQKMYSCVECAFHWASYKTVKIMLKYGGKLRRHICVETLEQIPSFIPVQDKDKKIALLKSWSPVVSLHTLTLRSVIIHKVDVTYVPKSVLNFNFKI